MKWRSAEPRHGDLRVSRYFAFFPTKLDDGHTVWLSSYYVKERYVIKERASPYGYTYDTYGWEWVVTSASPLYLETPLQTPVNRVRLRMACEAFARMQGRQAFARLVNHNSDWDTFERAMEAAIQASSGVK